MIALTTGLGAERIHLDRNYSRAVTAGGGFPVLLPPDADPEEVLQRFAGLVLTGGGDLDPHYYGEEPASGLGSVSPERDWFEIRLARLFLAAGKPILGICRGLQVLVVAAGGSLYQDLPAGAIQHYQRAPREHRSHGIRLSGDSTLAGVLGGTEFRVNSFHHQAVRDLPAGFRAVGFSPDGIIEAVEATEGPFLGVQWHPEDLFAERPEAAALFRYFVERVGRAS